MTQILQNMNQAIPTGIPPFEQPTKLGWLMPFPERCSELRKNK